MEQKFMQLFADEAAGRSPQRPEFPSNLPGWHWLHDPFPKQYCFFYGTLMDPSTLARILQLPEPPILRPAKVIGYHVKLWGPYPALLRGPQSHPVDGLAYELQSREQLDRLSAYETSKYRIKPCWISFTGEPGDEVERVRGIVFIRNGELDELREGDFNLEKWLQQQPR